MIRQKSDNTIKHEVNKHTHGTTLTFEESWVNSVDGSQDMEVEVIVILDHDGNTSSKKVGFHCDGQ